METYIMWGAIVALVIMGFVAAFLHYELDLTKGWLVNSKSAHALSRNQFTETQARLENELTEANQKLSDLDDELTSHNSTSIKQLMAERSVREAIDEMERVERYNSRDIYETLRDQLHGHLWADSVINYHTPLTIHQYHQ
jgi:hypothetical protein